MKFHLGYGVASLGYMVGIYLASSSTEDAGGAMGIPALWWNLLHIPLFAGLAACLLLSLAEGQWSRKLPGWVYGVVLAVAALYAAFAEWQQTFVAGRHGTLQDFLLNSLGVAGLVVVHRVASRNWAKP